MCLSWITEQCLVCGFHFSNTLFATLFSVSPSLLSEQDTQHCAIALEGSTHPEVAGCGLKVSEATGFLYEP